MHIIAKATKYISYKFSLLTLRAKMLLLFGGGTTIILILIQIVQLFGLSPLQYEGEYIQQTKKIYAETQLIADHEKNLISVWFAERLGDLSVFSQQKSVPELLRLTYFSQQNTQNEADLRLDLQSHMEEIRSAYGFYDAIDVIAAKTGKTLASTDHTHINQRHILTDEILLTKNSSGTQKIIFKKINEQKHPNLFITAIIFGKSNIEPIGAVVFQISLDVFLEQILVAKRYLGETGEVIFIDMHKRLLTPLDHPLRDGSIAEPLQYTMNSQAAKFATWGVDSLIENKDYRGIDVVAAIRHIRLTEDYAISMIVNRNKAHLYGPVWNNLFIFLAISFMGLCTIIVLIVVVSKQLARPLEQLNKASSLIHAGALSTRVPELSGVEASSLAHAFNAMAQTIEESQKTLQEQVELRTEALHTLSVRQEAILIAVPDIFAEIDSDLTYTWVNSAGLSFFGDGVIGNSISNYFVEDQETIMNIELLFTGSVKLLYTESKQRRFDGQTRVLAWRCKALVDENGRATAVLATARDITKSKWAEKELQKREERFRGLLNNIPDLIWFKDIDGVYLMCNSTFERFFGTTVNVIVGKTDYDFMDREQADFFRMHDKNAVNAKKATSNEEWISFPGDVHPTLLYTTKTPMYEKNGDFIGVLGIGRDITEIKKAEEEKRKLQEQLQHAQKIEAVGRLAGGVAHDFNNMLSVIQGHAELALEYLQPHALVFDDINEIIKAAKRSSSLTKQLLAFARRQTITPQILDLNKCIEGTLSMLGRLIGENIELVWKPSVQQKMVKIDPTQVEQVLANLCINSKDAITNTGTVTIITSNCFLDETFCETHEDVLPGSYITLTISDNGRGMSAETQKNIFEPFYTTKELGKGTGLGLATVYGIVKQNNGAIDVISDKEVGSTFIMYFPMCHLDGQFIKEDEKEQQITQGNETILIVEDEPILLEMAVRMLEHDGYKVYGAITPEQAIAYAESHKDVLHLIITDVIMPDMNGRELAEKLQTIVPDCQCLFMSGYTADVIAHHGVLEMNVHFIPKPFSKKELNLKVRTILDGTKIL